MCLEQGERVGAIQKTAARNQKENSHNLAAGTEGGKRRSEGNPNHRRLEFSL